MTGDEMFEEGKRLVRVAAQMKLELDRNLAHTTKEQWMAWDCIKDAAAYMTSASAWMERHNERVKS
jgi:hypothetical protein